VDFVEEVENRAAFVDGDQGHPLAEGVFPPFLLPYLLVILYGDMNLGVMSGQVIGLGPTTNSNLMVLYWWYLAASKLPLFCY
jgi:hypothetical protein